MIKVDKGINDKSIHKMSIGFTVVGDINEQEQHITLLTLMMIMINVQQAELIEQMYHMQIHLKHLQLHL